MASNRVRAVEAYVQAIRSGEHAPAERAAKYLAEDVILSGNVTVSGPPQKIEGHAEVLKRITGFWPITQLLIRGGWSNIEEDGGRLKVSAELGLSDRNGPVPGINLTFSFNEADQINHIEQENLRPEPPIVTDKLPDFVKGIINSALANGTPIAVAYVDEHGQPVLSLRGSTQVYSDTQLCISMRNAEGGLIKAIEQNPRLSLLYRDTKTRTTLIFQGRGHIDTNQEVRDRVFELAPEVEQNHDPNRKGAALIIDLERMQGSTLRGAVRMERSLA